jgi:hypothetical protein
MISIHVKLFPIKVIKRNVISDMDCSSDNEGYGRVMSGGRKIDFSRFESCKSGKWTSQRCPDGSIFWWILQCCVDISKPPCQQNCIKKYSSWWCYFHCKWKLLIEITKNILWKKILKWSFFLLNCWTDEIYLKLLTLL